MNCKNCGIPISEEQKFCPNCGNPIDHSNNKNMGNFTNMSNVSVQQNNTAISSNKQISVNQPSDIGFGRNMEQDLEQFGTSNPYENINHSRSNDINISGSRGPINSRGNSGNTKVPASLKKKKSPWIIIFVCLLVFIVSGLFLLPILNEFNLKTYESEDYKMEYNANWKIDDTQEKMTLYYSDNDSRFIFNSVATFASLNFRIQNERDKKILYDEFYKVWTNVDGGILTGGTDTFLKLTDESMYARIDYKMNDRQNVGSFYVMVSEQNDKVLTFMSYCTQDNWKKMDSDIIDMLEGLVYKSEADSSDYNTFRAGNIKNYTSIGYMDYKVPECWTLDENRTSATQYKSNIFMFRDGVSLLDVKGVTPYDSVTMISGTTYEKMKNAVIKNYGSIKSESMKNINGKVWYVIVTPDYNSGGVSYHNEIYFTLSINNTHLYYFEAYVSNNTSKAKTKYFTESIEYILENTTLYKVNE